MSSDYVHGYSPTEQRRLTRMQEILNQAQLERLDLAGVHRLLDVGAGLGQMTRALAQAIDPGGVVVGVERDPRQLAEARRQARADGEADAVDLRAGDAVPLPLADDELGSFDVAHARFLLEHVTDPQAVVNEMIRAVRPGGRIILVDDDHDLLRLWPDCPALADVWQRYWKSFPDRGHDPLVGRRLPGLLREAGCRRVRVTMVFYGATRGDDLFEPVVDNLIGVLDGAVPLLAESGRVSREDMDRALAALARWRQQDDATVWYALPLAEGWR